MEKVRVFTLARLRSRADAREAGRAGAASGRGAGSGESGGGNAGGGNQGRKQNKRSTATQGSENNPPQREAKREKPGLKASDFSWAPNSLTAVLGRGRPVGVIEAFDALDIPGRPCGWSALLKDGCNKTGCRRCQQPGGKEAPQWAVAKIKKCCDAATLAALK